MPLWTQGEGTPRAEDTQPALSAWPSSAVPAAFPLLSHLSHCTNPQSPPPMEQAWSPRRRPQTGGNPRHLGKPCQLKIKINLKMTRASPAPGGRGPERLLPAVAGPSVEPRGHAGRPLLDLRPLHGAELGRSTARSRLSLLPREDLWDPQHWSQQESTGAADENVAGAGAQVPPTPSPMASAGALGRPPGPLRGRSLPPGFSARLLRPGCAGSPTPSTLRRWDLRVLGVSQWCPTPPRQGRPLWTRTLVAGAGLGSSSSTCMAILSLLSTVITCYCTVWGREKLSAILELLAARLIIKPP